MPTITNRTPKAKQHDPFYQSSIWKDLRSWFFGIPENTLCRKCKKEGKSTIAFICDHVLPRRWFPELELTPTNLQGLCRTCDQKKRQLEKGILSREHAYIVLREYL